MKKFLIAIIMIVIFSCQSAKNKIYNSKLPETTKLMFQMAGTYNSAKQARKDKNFRNISLRLTPIWQNKGDYLYVEQALFENIEKPYRVRIYKITNAEDGNLRIDIYNLKDETKWVGKWTTPDVFDALTISELDQREGCEIILKKISRHTYKGSTGEKTCESDLKGATYAISKVEVLSGKIITWDKGFDSKDKQVWGSERGAYIFNKI